MLHNVLLLAALSPIAADAQTTDAESQIVLSSLEGSWRGELVYSDYTSGERVALPATLDADLSATGTHLVNEIAFTDPGYVVRSFEVSSIVDGNLVTYGFDDDEPTRDVRTLVESTVRSAEEWTLVFEDRGEDDERAADIRLTRTMAGDRFTSTKTVRYLDDKDAGWIFRNELSLQREPTESQLDQLSGAWKIDLRQTPDAAPYFAPMVLSVSDDGELSGSFYGSKIEEARVNVAWGDVRFAFVTKDGTGAYHTSGRLRADGTVEGTTHSLGRDFLSVWTGVRREGSSAEGR